MLLYAQRVTNHSTLVLIIFAATSKSRLIVEIVKPSTVVSQHENNHKNQNCEKKIKFV